MLVGSLTDALGLRKTFLLGFALCIISRMFLTFTTVKWLALSGGMALLALGEGMGAPVTIAALRRYTTTAQRSIAYSVFYAIMNGGFFIALYISDALRAGMGEHGRFVVPGLGMELSTYRTIFLASLALSVPSFVHRLLLAAGGRRGDRPGRGRSPPSSPNIPGLNMFQALGLTIRDTLRETGRIFIGLWQQPGFYKFLAFLSFAAFIKMIFLHMDYTYPKFGIRELGEGAPIGHLYALNSILIVFPRPAGGRDDPEDSRLPHGHLREFRCRLLGLHHDDTSRSGSNGWPTAGWGTPSPMSGWGATRSFHPTTSATCPRSPSQLVRQLEHGQPFPERLLSPITRALLSRQIANGFRDESLCPHPTTALFSAADIKDVPAFLNRLQADPNPATRPVSQYLWDAVLFAGANLLFRGLRSGGVQGRRAAALARELNRILQGRPLV